MTPTICLSLLCSLVITNANRDLLQFSGSCNGDTLIAIKSGIDTNIAFQSKFENIDLSTGTTTTTTVQLEDGTAIEWHGSSVQPTTGDIYIAGQIGENQGGLMKISENTFCATESNSIINPEVVGNMDVAFEDIAFSVCSGELYGITRDGDIYSIDITNGATQMIGNRPTQGLEANYALSYDWDNNVFVRIIRLQIGSNAAKIDFFTISGGTITDISTLDIDNTNCPFGNDVAMEYIGPDLFAVTCWDYQVGQDPMVMIGTLDSSGDITAFATVFDDTLPVLTFEVTNLIPSMIINDQDTICMNPQCSPGPISCDLTTSEPDTTPSVTIGVCDIVPIDDILSECSDVIAELKLEIEELTKRIYALENKDDDCNKSKSKSKSKGKPARKRSP